MALSSQVILYLIKSIICGQLYRIPLYRGCQGQKVLLSLSFSSTWKIVPQRVVVKLLYSWKNTRLWPLSLDRPYPQGTKLQQRNIYFVCMHHTINTTCPNYLSFINFVPIKVSIICVLERKATDSTCDSNDDKRWVNCDLKSSLVLTLELSKIARSSSERNAEMLTSGCALPEKELLLFGCSE